MLPLSLLMLFIAWFYLARVLFRRTDMHLPGGRALIREHIARLGPMSRQEKMVAIVFAAAGFRLNLAGALVITGFVYLLLPYAWGIRLDGAVPAIR